VVSARAQKRDHPLARVARGVALSQVAEEINSFGFGKSRGQVERAFELELVWDSTKKIGDGFAAHFAQHRFTLFGRIRNVTHRDSWSWEWDCGLRIADCGLRIADCGLRIDKTFNLHFAPAVEQTHKSAIRNPQSAIPLPLFLLLLLRFYEVFVFARRQQAVDFARLADLDFDHPPVAVRRAVDQLRRVRQGLVDLRDLAGDRNVEFAESLHRFDLAESGVSFELLSHARQLDVNYVTQLLLREVRDADRAGAVGDADPFVILGVMKVIRVSSHSDSPENCL